MKQVWGAWLSRFSNWERSRSIRALGYILLAVLLYFLLLGIVIPPTYDLRVGALSPNTIRSPVQMTDSVATREAQKRAESSVPAQYVLDETVLDQQLLELDGIFALLHEVSGQQELSASEKEELLKAQLVLDSLTAEEYRELARISAEELARMHLIVRSAVIGILTEGVQEGNDFLQEARQKLTAQVGAFQLPPQISEIANKLAFSVIRPNLIYDPQQTQALRESKRNEVEPVVIEKGETLVRAGERITPEIYRKLELVGLVRGPQSNLITYSALAGFMALFTFLLRTYIKHMQPRLQRDNHAFLLYLSILGFNLVIFKIFSVIQSFGFDLISHVAPAALGVMLSILLLDRALALFTSFCLAIFGSMMFNTDPGALFDFGYGLPFFAGSVACLLVLKKVSQRTNILKAGLVAGLVQAVAITVLIHLSLGATWQVWLITSIYALLSGLFSAVLTIGMMPLFEGVFGILSAVKLIELTNPNQPLLRRLLTEAPGTYHHSVMVGNLAEAAAEAVGADGLLARVGAYYHDVGKIKRPAFFIENQMNQENPHDKISPHLSKSIIIAHPYDGVEMLKEAGIPKMIRDFAEQHHGTTLLKYFYHKALEASDGSGVLESDFRYPGPKPQTRETAIVSICDSVEAAVRAMSNPSPNRIEQLVRAIVKDRLEDGQLDECDLTMKDLETIVVSICETLNGLFHPRIEYPDLSKER